MKSQKESLRRLIQQAFQQHQAGRLQEAEKIYQQVLQQNPENGDANHLLGVLALQSGGKYEKAVQLISRAINSNPKQPAFYNNLGNALKAQGLFDKSIEAFQNALRIKPDFLDALYNLGNVLQETGNQAEAIEIYRQILDREPNSADVYNNLATALQEMDRLTEAADSLSKALAISPDFAEAHNNLGSVLKDQGLLVEALQHFRKGVAIKPDFSKAHSNMVCTLEYLPDISQEDIFQEARRWDQQHGAGLLQSNQSYQNSFDEKRRLRIGYVSPDLKSHSVAYFFEPVLAYHNSENVEIFCYANVKRPDNTTRRLQAATDHWTSIVGISDEDAARRIKEDRIDILVDLAGHTRDNRLLVFAHKLVPLQVNWLGYPNTTGLAAMDYRLTDAVADPIGKADDLYTEELVRLEHGFLCYQSDNKAPAVSEAPFIKNGYITFGSFNNLTKTTPAVVQNWSRILHSVTGSRLLLKAKQLADKTTRDRYMELFEKEGIGADRIEMQAWYSAREDHFGLYRRVDIGLDPFPYNGTTTTCEALWMGVPVFTLRGSRHSGRVGASILHRVGMQELIAENIDEYITMAQTLARDQQQLVRIRRTLRDKMGRSILMDKENFVRDLEDAFRQMWINWCRKQQNKQNG
jgi:predicted O-linked N-acetylglucosamine transferase (SPINDLY family)